MDSDELPSSELEENACKCSLSLLSLFLSHNSYFCFLTAGLSGLAKELLTDFADSLPGIDEAKSFMQVMG